MTVTATGFNPVFACWSDDDIGVVYSSGANEVNNTLETGIPVATVHATWTPSSGAGRTVAELSPGHVGPVVEPVGTVAAITGTLTLADTAGTLATTAIAFDVREREADRFSPASLNYVSGGAVAVSPDQRWIGSATSSAGAGISFGRRIHNGAQCLALVDDNDTTRVFPLPQLRDGQWHRVTVFPEGQTGYFSVAVDGQTVADRMSLAGTAHTPTRTLTNVFVRAMAVSTTSAGALSAPWVEVSNAVRYRLMDMDVAAPSVTVTADVGDVSATLTASVTL